MLTCHFCTIIVYYIVEAACTVKMKLQQQCTSNASKQKYGEIFVTNTLFCICFLISFLRFTVFVCFVTVVTFLRCITWFEDAVAVDMLMDNFESRHCCSNNKVITFSLISLLIEVDFRYLKQKKKFRNLSHYNFIITSIRQFNSKVIKDEKD